MPACQILVFSPIKTARLLLENLLQCGTFVEPPRQAGLAYYCAAFGYGPVLIVVSPALPNILPVSQAHVVRRVRSQRSRCRIVRRAYLPRGRLATEHATRAQQCPARTGLAQSVSICAHGRTWRAGIPRATRAANKVFGRVWLLLCAHLVAFADGKARGTCIWARVRLEDGGRGPFREAECAHVASHAFGRSRSCGQKI